MKTTMVFKDNTIYICSFCGDKMKSKADTCPAHRTKEGRKETILQQLKLEKERGSATKKLFFFDREKLLKLYNITE